MSGNRRSEDAGEVPWPALVDLLTSVLITFMFFILVTTVAMSAMTMKVQVDQTHQHEESKKVSETAVVSATDVAVTQQSTLTVPTSPTDIPSNTLLPPPTSTLNSEDPISPDETQRLKDENEMLKQQLASMGASFAKSKEIKAIEEPAEQAMTLLFNPNEAGMTPPAETALVKYLNQALNRVGPGVSIEITAAEPSGVSFSQGRERALTRAMVVRNVLLEHKFDPQRVVFRYSEETKYKSTNWVRLKTIQAGAKPE
jgi:hypothetical protein